MGLLEKLTQKKKKLLEIKALYDHLERLKSILALELEQAYSSDEAVLEAKAKVKLLHDQMIKTVFNIERSLEELNYND